MSTNAKVMRGQLRQVVKEMLPEILTTEMQIALAKQLEANLQKQLTDMAERQKDALSYLIRQTTIVKKD